jgi:hypothetical protein
MTSPLGAADGFYPVSVRTANGTYSSSASVTYALVSTLGVTATSTQSTYTRSQTAIVSATVKAAGTAVAGVPVIFTMTRSNGTAMTSTATTGANGVATFKYTFNRKNDPAGMYQLRGQTSTNGVAGNGSVSFLVK